jgi:TPP-dependent trihydroxycyclohexane-1,2-dione (THcHDO) dehydratase
MKNDSTNFERESDFPDLWRPEIMRTLQGWFGIWGSGDVRHLNSSLSASKAPMSSSPPENIGMASIDIALNRVAKRTSFATIVYFIFAPRKSNEFSAESA